MDRMTDFNLCMSIVIKYGSSSSISVNLGEGIASDWLVQRLVAYTQWTIKNMTFYFWL